MPTRGAAIAAMLAAIALCLTLPSVAAASSSGFSDVEDAAWYGGEDGCVAYVAKAEVMVGYPGTGLFGPEDRLTRAQAVTALYRLVEGDAERATFDAGVYSALADESGFSDAADGAYYTAALNWAAAEGVARGSGGLFRPNDPVTREELVTLAGRAAGHYVPKEIAQIALFIEVLDEDLISAWARESMKWGHQWIISGNAVDNARSDVVRLRPLDYATRAECTKILQRLDHVLYWKEIESTP